MYRFGKQSKKNLATLSREAQEILNEAIKIIDFTIISGYRSPERQLELFKHGRELRNKKWVIIDRKKVVTFCDGVNKKSNHQDKKNPAFDAVPYPIDWRNEKRFYMLAGVFKAVAHKLGYKLKWGGEWKGFRDLPHYEVN